LSLGLNDSDQVADRPMGFDGVPKRLARPDKVMILPADPFPLNEVCCLEVGDDPLNSSFSDSNPLRHLPQHNRRMLRQQD
jgi:hypothetical protein